MTNLPPKFTPGDTQIIKMIATNNHEQREIIKAMHEHASIDLCAMSNRISINVQYRRLTAYMFCISHVLQVACSTCRISIDIRVMLVSCRMFYIVNRTKFPNRK